MKNRRQFINQLGQTSLGVLTAAQLQILGHSCSSRKTSKRPNIIFILADDLGYGDLGCYGQTKIRTPHLDQMAAEGMRFTDHYAGSTVCAPSRCSLMTGRHTGRSWVRGNYENGAFGFGACLELRPEDVTVAEILQKAGYRTGFFGKWSLGVLGTTGQPDKKGFDEYLGYLNQGHAHFYYPEYLWKNGEKIDLDGNRDGARGQYSHDLFVAEALNFIRDCESQPFFLYLPFTIPHAELLVPEDSLEEYRDSFPEIPHYDEKDGGSGHYATQLTPHAAFAAMVTRMDRDVGKIFELLKEIGIDEDTLVFFSSDNGPHAEGGGDPGFFNSSGPLRGIKRDLYEGGIRVPLIVRWPGTVRAGAVCSFVSAFWDFLPTVCDLTDLPVPDDIDGLSFLPSLLGKSQKAHDYLYWEFHERVSSEQAIRKGHWKAVRHDPDGPIELYDLSSDISESDDVAAKFPEIVADMKRLFLSARTPHELWPLKRAKSNGM